MSFLARVPIRTVSPLVDAGGAARSSSPVPRHKVLASAAALGLAAWLGSVSPVSAEATVVVDLKTPDGKQAEGTVELRKGETVFRCTTQQGRCEIKGVPGGMYNAGVLQGDKPAAKPKSVMIPPSGEVKLIVNAS